MTTKDSTFGVLLRMVLQLIPKVFDGDGQLDPIEAQAFAAFAGIVLGLIGMILAGLGYIPDAPVYLIAASAGAGYLGLLAPVRGTPCGSNVPCCKNPAVTIVTSTQLVNEPPTGGK